MKKALEKFTANSNFFKKHARVLKTLNTLNSLFRIFYELFSICYANDQIRENLIDIEFYSTFFSFFFSSRLFKVVLLLWSKHARNVFFIFLYQCDVYILFLWDVPRTKKNRTYGHYTGILSTSHEHTFPPWDYGCIKKPWKGMLNIYLYGTQFVMFREYVLLTFLIQIVFILYLNATINHRYESNDSKNHS